MLPDIGAGELLLIGIVALVVVGPKDLPMLMRRLGQFTARLRGMAAEFRASFDEMGRQSELDELRREVEALRSGRLADEELGRADAQAVMREIESGLARGDMQMHPYAASQSLSQPEGPAATEAPSPTSAPESATKPASEPDPPPTAAPPRKAATPTAAKPKAPAKAKAASASRKPAAQPKPAASGEKAPAAKTPRTRRKPTEGQA